MGEVISPGFHPGGGSKLPPPPPEKKKRKERGVEGGGGRGEGEREMWSLREAILFVGGVRERKKKILERRNMIWCTCRCHAHLPPLTRFSR